MRRSQPCMAALCAAMGATCAIFLDPRSGRRRRAIARDKLLHYMRVCVFQGRRRGRHLAGPVRGFPHRVADFVPLTKHPASVDSTELKHRVESRLGREVTLQLNMVNIDAVDGIIRVRGIAADTKQARRLVECAAKVGGVKGVLSLLRTPDGLPVGGAVGEAEATGRTREVRAKRLYSTVIERWPWLGAQDALACEGRPGRLCRYIAEHEQRPEDDVRRDLEGILLAAIDSPR